MSIHVPHRRSKYESRSKVVEPTPAITETNTNATRSDNGVTQVSGPVAERNHTAISHSQQSKTQQDISTAGQFLISSETSDEEQQASAIADRVIEGSEDTDEMTSMTTQIRSQRAPATANDDIPSVVSDAIAEDGEQIDPDVREALEEQLGADFDSIEIHTGPTAAAAADAVDARAFTVGNHIVFGEGEYDPDSLDGEALLTEELVHNIQQNELGTLLLQRRVTSEEFDEETPADEDHTTNTTYKWTHHELLSQVPAAVESELLAIEPSPNWLEGTISVLADDSVRTENATAIARLEPPAAWVQSLHTETSILETADAAVVSRLATSSPPVNWIQHNEASLLDSPTKALSLIDEYETGSMTDDTTDDHNATFGDADGDDDSDPDDQSTNGDTDPNDTDSNSTQTDGDT